MKESYFETARGQELSWFLFFRDHHSGPYFFREAHSRIRAELSTGAVYAWIQGMQEWQEIKKIEDFERLAELKSNLQIEFLMETSEATPIGFTSSKAKNRIDDGQLPSVLSSDRMGGAGLSFVEAVKEPGAGLGAPEKDVQPLNDLNRPIIRRSGENSRSPMFWILLGAAAVAVAFGSAKGINQMISERPKIALPSVLDVSAEDLKDLQRGLGTSGSDFSAGVAMSMANLHEPSFFISTRLQDGSSVDVYVETVPEYVKDFQEISMKATIVMGDGLGRTPRLKQEDGQPLPMGRYKVSIFCKECLGKEIKDRSIPIQAKGFPLGEKLFFVGGEPTAEYNKDIQSLHEQLREQAKLEIYEIQQVVQALESQLQESRGRKASQWSTYSLSIKNFLKTSNRNSQGRKLFYPSAYVALNKNVAGIESIEKEKARVLARLGKNPFANEEGAEKIIQLSADLISAELASIKVRLGIAQKNLESTLGLPQKIEF